MRLTESGDGEKPRERQRGKSVSYTHLDVYKRQMLGRSVFKSFMPKGDSEEKGEL